MLRIVDSKELVHERLGKSFETALSNYDTQRRVETLVDDFLGADLLEGAEALEVGCGLGYFSERMQQLGAQVTACDLGPNLVEQTRQRTACNAVVADALNLQDTFTPDSFDVVLSSECVEHTPDPDRAIRQIIAMAKPGGYVSLSTPNIVWWPIVKLATLLHLRPFDGLENFSSWNSIRRIFADEKVIIAREFGLHLYPFQFGMHQFSTRLDNSCQFARPAMINICILGQKAAD